MKVSDEDVTAQAPTSGEILQWVKRIEAVTAESLAVRLEIELGSARARLRAVQRSGKLMSHRPLNGAPALYTLAGHAPIGAARALHAIECAAVAAVLERSYPCCTLIADRELRHLERKRGRALASVVLGRDVRGKVIHHHPDFALFPPAGVTPVAVEVELTVKAPWRLQRICRAWVRARCVAGVLYVAELDVERALGRAIKCAGAGERVLVLPLAALARECSIQSAT